MISFQPLPSENAFLISRTINGLKLLRQGNIEVDVQLRDILKFGNDFKLKDRSFSFVTQDGFDIGVQNFYLSPKTYGISGKTIAEQFSIKTVDTVTSTGGSTPVDVIPSDSGTGTVKPDNIPVVPCGLNRKVQVLVTRNNQSNFETQNSPSCKVDFEKVPKHKDVEDFKELCPKEDQPGYDPKCKEEDFFKDIFKTLSDGLKIDSDSFKIKDITSDRCSAIEMDFSNAPLLKAGVIRFNTHCEYFSQNPSTEQFLRTVSMIGWFIFALFKLLSA